MWGFRCCVFWVRPHVAVCDLYEASPIQEGSSWMLFRQELHEWSPFTFGSLWRLWHHSTALWFKHHFLLINKFFPMLWSEGDILIMDSVKQVSEKCPHAVLWSMVSDSGHCSRIRGNPETSVRLKKKSLLQLLVLPKWHVGNPKRCYFLMLEW